MNVLTDQLNDLLRNSTGLHGYWLVNNREAIEELLKSGIIRYGIKGMTAKLHDLEDPITKQCYKDIEEAYHV